MRAVCPIAVLGTAVNHLAVLVVSISVIRRGDQVGIVTIAAARMPSDAVHDRGAIHKVGDIVLQRLELGIHGDLLWTDPRCRNLQVGYKAAWRDSCCTIVQ